MHFVARFTLVFIGFVAALPFSACSRHYHLDRRQSEIALKAIGEDRDQVVVEATKGRGSKHEIFIELRPRDMVRCESGGPDHSGETQGAEEGMLFRIAAPQGCERLTVLSFYESKRSYRAKALIWSGVGSFFLGYLIQLPLAMLENSRILGPDKTDAWPYIPIYGAARLIGSSQDGFLNEGGSILATMSILGQVMAPILIGLGIYESFPIEKSGNRRRSGLHQASSIPTLSPFAEGGLLLSWRF